MNRRWKLLGLLPTTALFLSCGSLHQRFDLHAMNDNVSNVALPDRSRLNIFEDRDKNVRVVSGITNDHHHYGSLLRTSLFLINLSKDSIWVVRNDCIKFYTDRFKITRGVFDDNSINDRYYIPKFIAPNDTLVLNRYFNIAFRGSTKSFIKEFAKGHTYFSLVGITYQHKELQFDNYFLNLVHQ